MALDQALEAGPPFHRAGPPGAPLPSSPSKAAANAKGPALPFAPGGLHTATLLGGPQAVIAPPASSPANARTQPASSQSYQGASHHVASSPTAALFGSPLAIPPQHHGPAPTGPHSVDPHTSSTKTSLSDTADAVLRSTHTSTGGLSSSAPSPVLSRVNPSAPTGNRPFLPAQLSGGGVTHSGGGGGSSASGGGGAPHTLSLDQLEGPMLALADAEGG
jgi:hypothetical protein